MDRNRIAEIVRDNPQVLEEARTRIEGVLARSATDPEFRAELLSSPRTAMSKHLGKELPATYNVVFVENTADATIVLPDSINTSAELSEAELEAVSGGSGPACILFGGLIVAVVHEVSEMIR
jgi:hypothetical protein